MENYSLRKAIAANTWRRPLNETEIKVHDRGKKMHGGLPSAFGSILWPVESRSYNTITAKVMVGKVAMVAGLPIEESALGKAGVSFLTGLRDDISTLDFHGVSVEWADETEKASNAGGRLKPTLGLKPKRITAKIVISSQLLTQDSMGVDTLIEETLLNAVIDKVEETVFSDWAATKKKPAGIFLDSASSGEIDWSNISAMENILDANGTLKGNLAYITHPTLLTTAKTKLIDKAVGGGYIGNGTINDYPVFKSSNVPKTLGPGKDETGIVLANWRDFMLAQWGALEITTDPYTLATTGEVIITTNSFWDFGMIRKEAFAINSMK